MHDEKTVAYFDSQQARWSYGRYRRAVEFIQQQAGPDARLIDIGCGSGNILKLIREHTAVRDLVGLDPSQNYLAAVAALLGCETILGSILDPAVVQAHAGRFDFAVMGDVLHHLVGRTRAASRGRARQALSNALALLKEGGYLLLLEPVYYPRLMVGAIFYVKVAVTGISSGRHELFRKWANIGEPVVSYYDVPQLQAMVAQAGGAVLLETAEGPLRRLGPGVRHRRVTLVARKDG